MIGILNRKICDAGQLGFIVEKIEKNRNSRLLHALFASNSRTFRPNILNLIFAEFP